MRELKFRAWNIQEEFMHEVVSVGCDKKDKWNTLVYMKNGFIDSIEEPHILMQYACLNDENGTEIYEGDIVRHAWDEGIYEVVFEEGSFRVMAIGGVYDCQLLVEYPLEVIGNIYENPELLEESK